MDTQDIEIKEQNEVLQEESTSELNTDGILEFRDQLLSREILSCGVNVDHSILHFGAGYNNNMLYEYLSALVLNKMVESLSVRYIAVDPNEDKINKILELNNSTNLDLVTKQTDMQTFLEENAAEYDWSIITGVFDKKLYGDQQFEFLDRIINEALKISKEGVIFTFDSSVYVPNQEPDYSVESIIAYIQNVYSRYRISKINEYNYVICINKYYHSINN